ncbi:MAG: hypothetical protein WA144_15565 [Candidatus Methanoperedens sp.]
MSEIRCSCGKSLSENDMISHIKEKKEEDEEKWTCNPHDVWFDFGNSYRSAQLSLDETKIITTWHPR